MPSRMPSITLRRPRLDSDRTAAGGNEGRVRGRLRKRSIFSTPDVNDVCNEDRKVENGRIKGENGDVNMVKGAYKYLY